MTPLLFGLAAGLGAALRLAVGIRTTTWSALLIVNVVGSAALGALVRADVSAATATVVGVGFCGALTTFSSFALETRSLGLRLGTAYAALTLVCVCTAASITMGW